ncbi:MAG: FAD-binding oxidoreductase [Alphaproteobacteria bacterium]
MTLDRIKDILGPGGFIDDPADMAPYLTEWRRRWTGTTPVIARPRDTDQVAAILAHGNEAKIAIVPQGGHTGLCGGAMPDLSGDQVIVSLSRMNQIRRLDPEGFTATVEAGCVLADVQTAAGDADRLFPLSLASEGSAQIGGLLSTNAGGNAVLHYGSARDLTLGLEVVLPDGRIWNGLRALRKDNTGYDLKQLFIGAEGTLGIITAAVLKLFPKPDGMATALFALPSPAAAIALLSLARDIARDALTGFELMPRIGIEFTTRHMPDCRDPFEKPYPWYVLIEISSADGQAALERLFATALEQALVVDGVIAQSQAQRADLWRLRESLSEAQTFEGGSIKHDVSVPISAIPVFLERAITAVTALVPGIRPVPFGHVGDGNIHFNLSQPPDAVQEVFLDHREEANRLVHDIVVDLDGSISAEHGIGQAKLDELERYKPSVELDMMRQIKQALDPNDIMNPGKVLRTLP